MNGSDHDVEARSSIATTRVVGLRPRAPRRLVTINLDVRWHEFLYRNRNCCPGQRPASRSGYQAGPAHARSRRTDHSPDHSKVRSAARDEKVRRSGVPRELQRGRSCMGRDQRQLERRQRRVPELCDPARQHHPAANLCEGRLVASDAVIRSVFAHAQPLWRQREPHGFRIRLSKPRHRERQLQGDCVRRRWYRACQ